MDTTTPTPTPTPTTTTPRMRIVAREARASDLALTAEDGLALGARLYEPPEGAAPARATVLINPATAAPQRYYARFAAWAAQRGLRVVTYDYRGIGASRPRAGSLRGFRATMREWATLDATAALRRARELAPRDPLVLIGHSFGGQLLGLLPDVGRVAGAVLVGAQFGYYRHWEGALARARMALLWRTVVPASTALAGYLPGALGLGEDLPAGVAREWARWCTSPEYLLAHVPEARARYAAFGAPTVAYSFRDDAYAPRRAVRAFLAAMPRATVVHRELAPRDVGAPAVGHFGFFRPAFEPTLWTEALGFVDDVLAGRPPRVAALAAARARQDPWSLSEQEVMEDLGYA